MKRWLQKAQICYLLCPYCCLSNIQTFINHDIYDKGNLKKNVFFYIFPNLIKIKKFQEQLIILEGDYDGHFFAQGYFGSQSLHRKKIFQFFVPKRSGV